ncbi:MAG: selenide, water dikinase SelD [Clostridiales Family XIII bacterium]|jgi:selenide,water dikinase|nr:selenide, water dikinase SelD [Clostridiales Family XIII bacterium]
MKTQGGLLASSPFSGCAAKYGPGALQDMLAALPGPACPDLVVGYDTSDDAAAYRIDADTILLQTVDIFPPVADEPYFYGQIAAANALSDIYAMGGSPKLALNILCVPEGMDTGVVREILRGGGDKVREAGAVIAGGHTLKDPVPKYGLAVTGFVSPQKLRTNGGARPGDVLILTKALGTGILTTALKAGLLAAAEYVELMASMAALNKAASEVAGQCPGVHAMTDVTGFGLAGHAAEMARASGCCLVFDTGALPFLPGALEHARAGLVPVGAYANREHLLGAGVGAGAGAGVGSGAGMSVGASSGVGRGTGASASAGMGAGSGLSVGMGTGAGSDLDVGTGAGAVAMDAAVPEAVSDVVFDPQTSGGLLIAVDPGEAGRLLDELQRAGAICARRIGEAVPAEQNPLASGGIPMPEGTPTAKETPVTKKTPAAKVVLATKGAPASDAASAAEGAPAAEGTLAAKGAPVGKGALVAEDAPIVRFTA